MPEQYGNKNMTDSGAMGGGVGKFLPATQILSTQLDKVLGWKVPGYQRGAGKKYSYLHIWFWRNRR